MYGSMIEAIGAAAPFLLALTAALLLIAGGSLYRLKSIGVYSVDRHAAGRAAHVENALHAIFKLIISSALVAAAARAILAPDYPGGLFAPDMRMLASAMVNLVSAAPFVLVIFLLSRKVKDAASMMLIPAIISAAMIGGAGQVLAATAAIGAPFAEPLQRWPSLVPAIFAVGALLTAGVVVHFRLILQLAASASNRLALVIAAAANAAIPTILAIAIAAASLEASGGVTLKTARAIAETGVDVISSGAITHSAPSLDLGLDFQD